MFITKTTMTARSQLGYFFITFSPAAALLFFHTSLKPGGTNTYLCIHDKLHL